ncbi:MAG: flagellar hook-length control protein FliK [Geminicoccaceae bacterium]
MATPSGGAVQTTVAEGSLRPNIEFGGFDRLQPALSVESQPLDNVRFETVSSLGQFKTQGPSAPPPAGAQIALQIVRSLSDGVDRFSVHLQPAELGSVDIQLNFESGGRLSALITAERPETLELLQRDSRILERSLGDSGLKLANDGLSFALKQDQHQQQHGQGFQEQAQARHAAFRAERAYDDTPDSEQLPSAMRVDGLRLLDIET